MAQKNFVAWQPWQSTFLCHAMAHFHGTVPNVEPALSESLATKWGEEMEEEDKEGYEGIEKELQEDEGVGYASSSSSSSASASDIIWVSPQSLLLELSQRSATQKMRVMAWHTWHCHVPPQPYSKVYSQNVLSKRLISSITQHSVA